MLPRQPSLFRFPFSNLRQCCSSLSFLGILPCPCNELIVVSPTTADFVEEAVAAAAAIDDNDIACQLANENFQTTNDELAHHPYRKSYRQKQSPKQTPCFGRWATCKKPQKGLHPRMNKGSGFRLEFTCHDTHLPSAPELPPEDSVHEKRAYLLLPMYLSEALPQAQPVHRAEYAPCKGIAYPCAAWL